MAGWIKIHRKFPDWEWYDDPETVKLFLHLLLRVNYEPKYWHGIKVDRGQLVTSRSQLARELHFSERQVRTHLKRLVMTNEVTIKTTKQYSIITVSKYDTYQGDDDESDHQNDQVNDQRATNERPTSDQRATTTKEIKKEKEMEEDNNANTKRFSFRKELVLNGVSCELADEWMAIRKKKGAVNSEYAFNTLNSEARKAGIELYEAVEVCCQNQWRGFKADWYAKQISEKSGVMSAQRTQQRDINKIMRYASLANEAERAVRQQKTNNETSDKR